ncbi:hypothetical protein V8F20_007854 [Naviculisporaceae sp. PSN 640]
MKRGRWCFCCMSVLFKQSFRETSAIPILPFRWSTPTNVPKDRAKSTWKLKSFIYFIFLQLSTRISCVQQPNNSSLRVTI